MSSTKHEALLALLSEYRPLDAQEAQHLTTIKQLVATHADIFEPTCWAGHITASALVVDMVNKRVLLHYHKKLGRWLQFGGHSDPTDSSPAHTAWRETHEESGLEDLFFLPLDEPTLIDVDVHMIPARADMPEHPHLDLRYILGTRHPDAVVGLNDESGDFRWLSCVDALDLTEIDSGLRRLLRKAQRIVR